MATTPSFLPSPCPCVSPVRPYPSLFFKTLTIPSIGHALRRPLHLQVPLHVAKLSSNPGRSDDARSRTQENFMLHQKSSESPIDPKGPSTADLIFDMVCRRPVKRFNYKAWIAGALFIFMMRKTILFELSKWPGFAVAFFNHTISFLSTVSAYLLIWVLTDARKPIAWCLAIASRCLYSLIDIYTFILKTTPVPTLVISLLLSSAVLSIGETVRPNVANDQRKVLWVAILLAIAGVGGLIPIIVLLEGLVILTAFSIFVQKLDLLSAITPATTVLVAVASPIIQIVALSLFMLLAIHKNWKLRNQNKELIVEKSRPHPVFVGLTMAVGMCLSASWLHARHLAWMAA